MTYYEILEVSETASPEVIHMAYKTLARKYHPDVFLGDPKIAEEKMKQINEAYKILSDPQERAQYDIFLRWKKDRDSAAEKRKKQKTPKKEKTLPSLKRSIIAVFLLLVLIFALDVAAYVLAYTGSAFSLDYALFYAFLDFMLMTFLNLLFPLLIGTIKKECTPKFIGIMSWIISLSVMTILNALTDSSSGVAWVQALIYAVINKHILLQMHQQIQQRKHRIIAACTALLVLLFSMSGGLLGFIVIQNNTEITSGNTLDTTRYYIGDVDLKTDKSTTHYVDIDGNTHLIKYTSYYMDSNGNLIKINE